MVPCTPNPIEGLLLKGTPAIEVHENVLYVPIKDHSWHDDPCWGIYSRDGDLIEAAAYYRGPGKQLVGQSVKLPPPPPRPTAEAPEDCYIYGGVMIEHFGHFLLSSISRFWPIADPAADLFERGLPVLCHGVRSPDNWFQFSYVSDAFQALNLSPSLFRAFPGPTRIRKLIVVRPSFEEHNFVYPAYVRLARHLGVGLTLTSREAKAPAYLSRTHYPRLSQGFENEQELVEALASFGVEIIYPERLSLSEHVSMFQQHRVVCGMVSSTFHPAIFTPDLRAQLLCFSPTHIVNNNFQMLDDAARLKTEYLYLPSELLEVGAAGRMSSRFVMPAPKAVAGELLRHIQRRMV